MQDRIGRLVEHPKVVRDRIVLNSLDTNSTRITAIGKTPKNAIESGRAKGSSLERSTSRAVPGPPTLRRLAATASSRSEWVMLSGPRIARVGSCEHEVEERPDDNRGQKRLHGVSVPKPRTQPQRQRNQPGRREARSRERERDHEKHEVVLPDDRGEDEPGDNRTCKRAPVVARSTIAPAPRDQGGADDEHRHAPHHRIEPE